MLRKGLLPHIFTRFLFPILDEEKGRLFHHLSFSALSIARRPDEGYYDHHKDHPGKAHPGINEPLHYQVKYTADVPTQSSSKESQRKAKPLLYKSFPLS
jgi:hypothetical protein